MYVNGMAMLTGIATSIRFRSLVTLDSRTAEQLYSGLDEIFRLYNTAGFLLKDMHCDREFKTLIKSVYKTQDVDLHTAAAVRADVGAPNCS